MTNYIGYDDDENSLINCLFKRDDINECYRILFKLAKHKKEEAVWNFIINLFLDFYAELNPKLEHFIFKLKTDGPATSMTFARIIKNMFIRKSTSHNVYKARISVLTFKYTVTSLKKIKPSTTIDLLLSDPLNNKYSVLLTALHSKNIDKIAYKVFTHLKDGNDVDVVHRVIIGYFSKVYFTQAEAQAEEKEINVKIFEKWLQIKKNIPSEFYFHYLIAIIIHLFANQKDINESVLFVRPTPDIIVGL